MEFLLCLHLSHIPLLFGIRRRAAWGPKHFAIRYFPVPPCLLPHHIGEDEGGDDRGVGLDQETGGFGVELAPGDLLIGDCAAVGSEGGGAVADLAEIAPKRDVFLQILPDEGDDADGEVSCNPSSDLEESDGGSFADFFIPVDERPPSALFPI